MTLYLSKGEDLSHVIQRTGGGVLSLGNSMHGSITDIHGKMSAGSMAAQVLALVSDSLFVPCKITTLHIILTSVTCYTYSRTNKYLL